MTTLLTITTAVLAVCAVALGWRCARLRKKLKETDANWESHYSQSEARREECMEAMDIDHDFEYEILYPLGEPSVCVVYKKVKHKERLFYLCIKRFEDPDASFNRREAQELLDKLNEK